MLPSGSKIYQVNNNSDGSKNLNEEMVSKEKGFKSIVFIKSTHPSFSKHRFITSTIFSDFHC